MGLRLYKARSEAKPEISKGNLVKKFGAKLRQVFSKKKQSRIQSLEGTVVQEIQPAMSAHSNPLPVRGDCLFGERGQHVIQAHVDVEETGIEEGPESSVIDSVGCGNGTRDSISVIQDLGLGIDSQGFSIDRTLAAPGPLHDSIAQVSSQDLQDLQEQDDVEVGPSTPPSSSGFPNFKTPVLRHPRKARRSSCPPACTSSPESDHSSETLFGTPRHSQTLQSPIYSDHQTHGGLESHCWQILAEHLKTEEENVQNTTLKMVVEWMKVAHQTEVAELQSQVFTAEAILAARDVDLANEKDDHDADLKTIKTLKDERSVLRKRLAERNTELRTTKKEIQGLKSSLEEVLEQQSVDGSTREKPFLSKSQAVATSRGNREASVFNGENDESAARVYELEQQKNALTENLEYATEEVARLRSEAKLTERDVKELRAKDNFARLEVGHLHAMNAYYRSEMEGENPARTARVDGLLKRKDEKIGMLEMRAAEFAEQLGKDKEAEEVARVYAEGKISGLEKDLALRISEIAKLRDSRDELKQQKEEIFQMFQSRIMPSDVDAAFRRDYDIIRQDNTFLINLLNERQASLSDAEQPVTDLKAEKLILEQAAQATQLELQQLRSSINGLEASKAQLADKLHIQIEMHDEATASFTRQSTLQTEEIQRLLSDGADDGLMRRFQAQADELASHRADLMRLEALLSQWQMRALEVRDDFCPMLDQQEVRDWHSEESRWRLSWAERRAKECERQAGIERKRFVGLRRKVRGLVEESRKRERGERERKRKQGGL